MHCSRGHGRTGTICALLLGLAYHLSAPHAVLLYQALHDVAGKAFRHSYSLGDVRLVVSPAWGGAAARPVDVVLPASDCSTLATVRARLGLGEADKLFRLRDGEMVEVDSNSKIRYAVGDVLNDELLHSSPPRLELLLSRGGGATAAEAIAAADAADAADDVDDAAPLPTAAPPLPSPPPVGVSPEVADESALLTGLISGNCRECNALFPAQIEQVLFLLSGRDGIRARAEEEERAMLAELQATQGNAAYVEAVHGMQMSSRSPSRSAHASASEAPPAGEPLASGRTSRAPAGSSSGGAKKKSCVVQ